MALIFNRAQTSATIPLDLVRGEMNLTRNTLPTVVTAALDIDTPNATDYETVLNFTENANQYGGFTVVNSQLVIPKDGFYELSGYVNINHPLNNSSVAVAFIFNGTTYSPRSLKSFANDGNVFRLAAGEGSSWLTEGTQVGLAIAANLAGSVIVSDSTIVAKLISNVQS